MTWRTRNGLGAGFPRVVVGLLVAIGCLTCRQPPALAPGEVVESELGPEAEALYRVVLEPGDFARVVAAPVSSPGRELALRITGPGEDAVGEVTGIRFEYQGALSWVTEAGGDYRLRVANPDPVEAVPYRLVVAELRGPRPGDHDRAAAGNARAEAMRRAGAGDEPGAAAALGRALGHWRRIGDARGEITVLLDLVDLERYDDPAAALALAEEALGKSEAAGAIDLAVDALEWQGRVRRLLGDCAGALAAYRDALDRALAADLLKAAGSVEFNVGVLQERCQPELAAAAYRHAIELAERAGDPANAGVAYAELSIIARAAGDLESARDLVERGWDLVRDGDDPEAEADVAHELGIVDRDQGRLTEAYEHFLRCFELNEALGNRQRTASVLFNLGTLALDLRRPEDARAHLESSARVAEEIGDGESSARAQLELGAVHFREGDSRGSEDLVRRSLAIAGALDEEVAAALTAEGRGWLGRILLEQDRVAEAVVELRAALEYQEAAGLRRAEAYTRRTLGSALARSGEPAAGVEQLERALAFHRAAGDAVAIAWTLYRLAEVQAAVDPASARKPLEEAIEIGQRVRGGLLADRWRTGFAEGVRLFYDLYIDLLITAGEPAAAFHASEQGRARALLDLLSEAKVDLAADAPLELREREREVQHLISGLQLELRTAAGGEKAAVLRTRLEEAERDAWRVEAAMREGSLRYRHLQEPPIEGVERLRVRLPPGRALIEYWLGERGSYAFVVTRDGFSALRLAPAGEIRAQVGELRAALVGLQPPERYAVVAHRLFQDLLAPALAAAGPVEELVVVPDGALHLIPFEALVTTLPERGARFEDLAYLLRRFTVSYAPSAAVLTSLGQGRAPWRRPGGSETRLVAYADPRYDRPLAIECSGRSGDPAPAAGSLRAERLEPLEGSRREVRAIAKRFGRGARVHVGAEASEGRLKSSPETAAAERLHLAVHGFVCESLPERSGLVFALDGGSAGEDGILQVREIFQLELSADLVVLSACDTGSGRLMSGEGVVGLSRAFFYAGASSLVVSLWQVSDRSTERLMTTLYEGLERGEDRAAALRRSQLALIDGGGRQAAPFHWAPFVLLGERGATAAPRRE